MSGRIIEKLFSNMFFIVACIISIFAFNMFLDSDDNFIIFLLIFLNIAVPIYLYTLSKKIRRARWERQFIETLQKYQITDHFSIGHYLMGFDDVKRAEYEAVLDLSWYAKNDICGVTSNNILFFKPDGGVLGRVPMDNIMKVQVVRQSQLTSELTASLSVIPGVATHTSSTSLHHNFFLIIERLDNESRIKREILFKFVSESDANRASKKLMEYLPDGFQNKITIDEKKCPFCAEIIKKDAVICRFCNSELESKHQKGVIFCKKCDNKIYPNNKFCPKCGNRVDL